MEYITLNNGIRMPKLGASGWQSGNPKRDCP